MVDGGMEAEALAEIVIHGEAEGGKFSWETLTWEKDD